MKPVSFSLHWELRILLYLGVLMLSTGLGIWVYLHLDAIGHLGIVAVLALISAGGFLYCRRTQPAWSRDKVPSSGPLTDYTLLLACLTLITLVGYLQYQYSLPLRPTGLIPVALLALSAYYFDHLGVLSLAITTLAAWLGVVVTPLAILHDGNFGTPLLIYTGVFLGASLLLAGVLSQKTRFKPHFAFSYAHFGIHIVFIACLAGMFHYLDTAYWLLWLLLLLGLVWMVHGQAIRYRSFYFLVLVIAYGYIGLSAAVLKVMGSWNMAELYLAFLYFIGSGVGLAYILIHQNKKWKAHAMP